MKTKYSTQHDPERMRVEYGVHKILGRAPQVEVFPNDFFEQMPSGQWSVEDSSAGEFRLQDGNPVIVTCFMILAVKRIRQSVQPFVCQRLDFGFVQFIEDLL